MQDIAPPASTTPGQVDASEIAREILQQLKEGEARNMWVNREEHALQHAFIRTLMQERAERLEARKKLKERVVGALVVAAISAILTGLGYVGKWMIHFFSSHISIN